VFHARVPVQEAATVLDCTHDAPAALAVGLAVAAIALQLLTAYSAAVRAIDDYWAGTVRLP